VGGWAFDDAKVAKVEILVDSVLEGTANYGLPRPDVAGTYPHASANIGFSYSLDSTKFGDGPHIVNTRVTDNSGNVAVLSDLIITVSNSVGTSVWGPNTTWHGAPQPRRSRRASTWPK